MYKSRHFDRGRHKNTHTDTNKQTEWHWDKQLDAKCEKSKITMLPVGNAGPTGTEYLYYLPNVEGFALKDPILPVCIS